MSTSKKGIEYRDEEKPIRASEVRTMDDKDDLVTEHTYMPDKVEDRYPGESGNTEELDEDDNASPAVFGGPTTVKFARRKLLSLEDDEDDWYENDDEEESESQEDDLKEDDFEDEITVDEMELNRIRLQKLLDSRVDESEWVDVAGEEEIDGLSLDKGVNDIEDTANDQKDTDSTNVKKDTKNVKKHTKDNPRNFANIPAEPSGPAKSGPSYKPKDGDLDHFVEAPTEPIQIIQDEEDLNGTNRVAADGIATEEECNVLMDLVKRESRHGGGYDDKPYAHTKYELFEGVTIEEATQAAERGRVSLFYPLTMMHVAMRSRQFVEDYYNLTEKGLWFSYTHLVCRTAEVDSTWKRHDFSHPVHADNCDLDKDGNCHKKAPAFTWRDWSSITYLNDDFEGGDFVFAYFNHTVQSVVKPKCGRIVAFSAGEENLHGVKGVIKGSRCALALWFTQDSRYRELKFYSNAEKVTQMYSSVYGEEEEKDEEEKDGSKGDSEPDVERAEKTRPPRPKALELDQPVKTPLGPADVVMGDKGLNGTNRVVADGIASQEECKTLVRLVQAEAVIGDGYDDDKSSLASHAHTKYELFEGLTITNATQAMREERISMFYPLTYVNVAERSRQFVEEYFNLAKDSLYISFSHLVCRTAESYSTKDRKDLSHQIHGDNCDLDGYGRCQKKPPAFVWRDWSAITYLNNDFEGGEFIFAYANQTVQAEVMPQSGRIVAFSAGAENLHGVKAVVGGSRCALALWFTHDYRYREEDFYVAARHLPEMYESVYGQQKRDEL